MEKFDLIVIGAGPAGYAAAMRSIDFKKKTLLIEGQDLGGAGLTNGALSSKTWWELSRKLMAFSHASKALGAKNPPVPFWEVRAQVRIAVNEKKSLLQEHLEALGKSSFAEFMTYKTGRAKLLSQNEVEIKNDSQSETVWGDNILLATGSRPRSLPEFPIDEKIVMTSNGIENMEEFPASMVIVGAGVIGCEFATIFSNCGYTKVFLIDKGDRILPFEDADVVTIVEQNLENNGVTIHRNSQLKKMQVVDGMVEYELEFNDGSLQTFAVEKALISVGRVANTENLWSDTVGIELSKRGINNNDTLTNIPNIYAVGDLTADISLVNVAELEGRYAVEKMFDKPVKPLEYNNISTIMFLGPEVAGVGINEITAKEKGISYKVATLEYNTISRAIAKRNTQGFIKLIVTNEEEMKILGMKVIGHQASSTIQTVAVLISMNKGIHELAECIHPHPSITEGVQECVRILLGKSILKPGVMINRLSCRSFIDGVYNDLHFI